MHVWFENVSFASKYKNYTLLRKYFFQEDLNYSIKSMDFSYVPAVLVLVNVDGACNVCLTWWLSFEWQCWYSY